VRHQPTERAPDPERERPPEAAPPEHDGSAAATLLDLQQSHGNAWVARAVQRGLMRQPDAEHAARQAFIARGVMPSAAGLDFQPSTGLGGFNVRYDPATSELVATLKVGIDFKDALTADPATGVVTPATAGFATAAASVMANNPGATPEAIAARIAEVQADWQWSAQQKTDWAGDYEATAEGMWGGQHHFTADRWDDVYADVRVDMDVHIGHRVGDHCAATVFKDPPGNRMGPGAAVTSTTGNATATTGDFRASDITGTNDYLNYSLQFESNSANLRTAVSTSLEAPGDAGDAHLDKLIVDFQRGTPTGGAHITVTGHASTTGDGDHNLRLSRRRAEAVAAYLRTHGDKIAGSRITVEAVGADGAEADESWQRVDIRIGDGRAQVTMAHETGHMFGLDDEYASPPGGIAPGAGTAGQIGTPVGHSALSGAMGGGVQAAVFENNDNIMSVGNVVRPQHYATFLEGLNLVAAPERFHYGGAGHSPTAIPDLIGPDVVRPPDATPTAVA
jgi:outer membrane protein OmpA-like peptidoglycan-associated protein